jgi:hypothetical protein
MVLADVILVFLCLVDDHKLLLHQLSELNLFPLFDDRQLSFFEFCDSYDTVVVVIVVFVFPGLDASRCPDQPSLSR